MKVKHLEKITFIMVLVIFALSIITFSSSTIKLPEPFRDSDLFTLKRISGSDYFIFGREITLMPGELISYYNLKGEEVKSYEVESILIPSRETIDIYTNSAKISGITRQEFKLDKNWHSVPGFLAIRQGKETVQIKISEILRIKGKLWLSMNASADDLNDNELTPSFYQRTVTSQVENNVQERVKWLSPTTEENKSAYDLFTPPIIYIHDGELTAKLPEKQSVEEVAEPFGLSLIGITKVKYPLRLISWVGNTPYFDDLLSITDQNQRVVRNRLEVGKPYKRVIDRKPGQPSLEICENNDTERLITVQYFTVQQYRNPETGGLKPVGRAMILDHKLGGSPFEINTLMREVDAGNFTLNFEASLPGLKSMDFKFESSQSAVTFDYGGRRYLVSDLDLVNKSVKVTKQDPRITEDSYQIFSF